MRAPRDDDARLALLADMCRLNALVAVKRAGSGHLGSSFSALDIVVHLLYEELNTARARLGAPRPRRLLLLEGPRRARPLRGAARARRDPDRAAAAAAAARRARRASRRRRPRDRGELRLARDGHLEGTRHRLGEAAPRPRRPRRRDDRRRRAPGGPELGGAAGARRTSALGEPLGRSSTATSSSPTSRPRRSSRSATSRRSSRAFGWHVETLRRARPRRAPRACSPTSATVDDGPKALVARHDQGARASRSWSTRRARRGRRHVPLARRRARRRGTSRGRTPSSTRASRAARGARPRALGSSRSTAARTRCASARGRAGERRRSAGAGEGDGRVRRRGVRRGARSSSRDERDELVVLDADLASDCRVRAFELAHPERFVECGIAEQDMVSMAAGLARQGLLPVVNSFASFLAVARERADLQPGERGHEGRLRAPLRRADPGRARQVAPEPPRHLPARRAART